MFGFRDVVCDPHIVRLVHFSVNCLLKILLHVPIHMHCLYLFHAHVLGLLYDENIECSC